MDAAETLLAIEQIKQLKGRYFRFMDTKDWEALATIFTEDAEFDARASLSVSGKGESGRAAESNDWVYRGGSSIVEFIRQAAGDSITCHHGHNHDIEILSPTEAHGVIAMEDQIFASDTNTLIVHGCGHYHETYAKVHDQWRIRTSRITRLYVDLGQTG